MCALRLLALAGFLFCAAVLSAQDVGQACLLAFADWDENGARAQAEPALSRGIGADLLNAQGITLASQLLADSPFASQGLLCFNQLAGGEYQLRLTSAAYAATAKASGSAIVVVGEPPPRIELGVMPLFEESRARIQGTAQRQDATITLLLAAAAFVMALLLAAVTFALLAMQSTGRFRLPAVFSRRARGYN